MLEEPKPAKCDQAHLIWYSLSSNRGPHSVRATDWEPRGFSKVWWRKEMKSLSLHSVITRLLVSCEGLGL